MVIAREFREAFDTDQWDELDLEAFTEGVADSVLSVLNRFWKDGAQPRGAMELDDPDCWYPAAIDAGRGAEVAAKFRAAKQSNKGKE